jgi:lauroyl/myristoyl acyltransferase
MRTALPSHEDDPQSDAHRRRWSGRVDASRRAPAIVRALLAISNVYRRLLAAILGVVGPRAAYAIMGPLARLLYRLFDPFRLRSEAQCRSALGGRLPEQDIHRIAEEGFVHRIWNLTDLMLADRLLHAGTFERYCRRIPADCLALLDQARRQRQPMIFVTAYYGPFDLLPVFLAFNGLRPGVVYRPHPNAAFDAYRSRVRGRGGCELIPVSEASARLGQILSAGGAVAIVADHHVERGGEPATFLGLPTRVMRSVGLLAWRYQAAVVVAGIRRVDRAFRFELVVEDLFWPPDWQDEPDPVVWITRRYLAGLERLILADPSQYLWAYPRWGEDFLQHLLDEHTSSAAPGS